MTAHNDKVNAHLESILRQVVAIADDMGTSGVELLEETHQALGGDVELADDAHWRAQRVIDLLTPHTTPELDEADLVIELIELAGDSDYDLYND